MHSVTLVQGSKYSAEITLNFLEKLAGNDTIAQKLRDAGFSNVEVVGDGAKRRAVGIWTGATRDNVELPKQVTAVRRIP